MNEWGMVSAGEVGVTGGNDGSLVLNLLEMSQPGGEAYVLGDGSVSCVGAVSTFPKVKLPSSLARHFFPSDTYFHYSSDVEQSFLLGNESVMVSRAMRDVFIGPEGKIFTIFESGDIALLRSDNDKASELTPLQPRLSPMLSERVSKEAEFIDNDGVHLRQDRLFPGYCVSGVHRESRRFALGGRWGCLGIYEIIDGG
ncbi:unnamed protein product [Hydatigera taeniaeformis]|uniref:DUF3700 domain-containing protein n=1 Tax=Hydatigena taeniaeformis TaxID=6205 RepID=A0A0R3X859_HYDTA|nr:unnamed protein product [Hydatigera taeniaeformis]